MSIPVVMPQLGLTMTEGSVSEWLKKPGDTVQKGEMLFIVSTDKADMEVESLDEGTLTQIVVEPGNVVPVGTVIAYLGGSGEVAAHPGPAAEVKAPAPQPALRESAVGAVKKPTLAASAAQEGDESFPVSPRARKVARELGVDISQVKPREGSGRIVEEDVRRYAVSNQPAVAEAPHPDLRRRQVIAERMTQSVQSIPHFSVSIEVRADQLIAMRENLKVQAEKRAGIRISVTDFLLKALGQALAESPEMRMIWKDGRGPSPVAADLGLAIASDRGVVAPVMRNPGAADLAEIAGWRHTVTDKARGGRLALSDLEGGAGTLSNLGMYRVDRFQAIISPGQSFILAAGKLDYRPWVEAGALIVASTISLTLSVDHRVADGAVAAQFLERIAKVIENPSHLA